MIPTTNPSIIRESIHPTMGDEELLKILRAEAARGATDADLHRLAELYAQDKQPADKEPMHAIGKAEKIGADPAGPVNRFLDSATGVPGVLVGAGKHLAGVTAPIIKPAYDFVRGHVPGFVADYMPPSGNTEPSNPDQKMGAGAATAAQHVAEGIGMVEAPFEAVRGAKNVVSMVRRGAGTVADVLENPLVGGGVGAVVNGYIGKTPGSALSGFLAGMGGSGAVGQARRSLRALEGAAEATSAATKVKGPQPTLAGGAATSDFEQEVATGLRQRLEQLAHERSNAVYDATNAATTDGAADTATAAHLGDMADSPARAGATTDFTKVNPNAGGTLVPHRPMDTLAAELRARLDGGQPVEGPTTTPDLATAAHLDDAAASPARAGAATDFTRQQPQPNPNAGGRLAPRSDTVEGAMTDAVNDVRQPDAVDLGPSSPGGGFTTPQPLRYTAKRTGQDPVIVPEPKVPTPKAEPAPAARPEAPPAASTDTPSAIEKALRDSLGERMRPQSPLADPDAADLAKVQFGGLNADPINRWPKHGEMRQPVTPEMLDLLKAKSDLLPMELRQMLAQAITRGKP